MFCFVVPVVYLVVLVWLEKASDTEQVDSGRHQSNCRSSIRAEWPLTVLFPETLGLEWALELVFFPFSKLKQDTCSLGFYILTTCTVISGWVIDL